MKDRRRNSRSVVARQYSKRISRTSESNSEQEKTESTVAENSLEARLKSEQQQLTLDKLATDLNTTVESLKETAEKHNIELLKTKLPRNKPLNYVTTYCRINKEVRTVKVKDLAKELGQNIETFIEFLGDVDIRVKSSSAKLNLKPFV